MPIFTWNVVQIVQTLFTCVHVCGSSIFFVSVFLLGCMPLLDRWILIEFQSWYIWALSLGTLIQMYLCYVFLGNESSCRAAKHTLRDAYLSPDGAWKWVPSLWDRRNWEQIFIIPERLYTEALPSFLRREQQQKWHNCCNSNYGSKWQQYYSTTLSNTY